MICKHCGREFTRKVELRIHQHIDHLPERKQHKFYFWNVKKESHESRISK